MERTVYRDNRGMSLIELMISMVLMMAVAIALMQSSLIAMNTNVMNEMRNEGVSVAEQQMNIVRNTPFASLSTLPTSTTVYRNIRAKINTPFAVSLAQGVINANSTQVTVTVNWSYQNRPFSTSMSTVMRNQ
jgi:type II secretory pathway pseudopilin PulG